MLDARLRKDFPVLKQDGLVYLDSAASALTPKPVIEALKEYYTDFSVNVHRGVYRLSYDATQKYEAARQTIANAINANFEEVVFTKGATSALNLVAMSYGMANVKAGDEIIVSELEHHSHLLPWQNVAKKTGASLVYLPLTKAGRITVENFKSVVSKRTKIVALTHVSNVLGYQTPIEEIIEIAHQQDAIVCVDAAQSVPHQRVDVRALDCDFLAFSGHKMCGPTGIGVMYGKKHLLDNMDPIELGGDMNDYVDKNRYEVKDTPYRFEAGTPPIAQAIGLAKAFDYLNTLGFDQIARHEKALLKQALEGLSKIENVIIHNPSSDTGIIAFNLKGVHPHDAISFFDEDQIAMRAGHHCAQTVIQFLNVPATLRASFYIYNTPDDVERFLKNVSKAVAFFKSVGF